ncbi:hypothetical protein [Candidatus Electronema sp. JM]|uniref:hypothetical protein n=1 Tax=Candidatus Electronema sp. JM TaxID=3401571 RepID=UPI003AA8DB96
MSAFLQPAFRSTLRVNWFERQRDFFVRQFFADFFNLMLSFQELYRSYCICRTTRRDGSSCCLLVSSEQHEQCSIWDQLAVLVGTEMEKGPLWLLKDLGQQIWPDGGPTQKIEDSLIEWLVSSIFHEAVKLKEDVHILNSYSSAAFWSGSPTRHFGHLPQIMDRKGLIQRVAVDVMRQMEQLALLFGQASNMLRTLLPTLSGNILLVRFLVEREDIVEELWSESLCSVFQDMFDQASQGFCAAGRSYMSGQWHTRALIMYRRALELDCGCAEAAAKVDELQLLIQQTGGCLGAA